MNEQSKSRSIWIFHMIYLQKESFVTPEFIFRIGSQTSAAGTLITLLREFGGCWGYLHQTDYNLISPNLQNLTVALSLERLGPRASGLAITRWPGPSSLWVVLAPRSAWPNLGVLLPTLHPALGLPSLPKLMLMLLPMLKSGADWYMRAPPTRLVLMYLWKNPELAVVDFNLGALSYLAVHRRCSPDCRSEAAKL